MINRRGDRLDDQCASFDADVHLTVGLKARFIGQMFGNPERQAVAPDFDFCAHGHLIAYLRCRYILSRYAMQISESAVRNGLHERLKIRLKTTKIPWENSK